MGMESSDKTDMPAQPVLSEAEGSIVEGTDAVESGTDPSLSSTVGDPSCETDEVAGLADGLSEQELKGIIEALLFVSREPLLLDKVTTVLAGPPKVSIHNAMKALQQDYDQDGRGLQIVELAGGYAMVTRADCAPWITKLHKVKASVKVSRSALETLAIIAYKQPNHACGDRTDSRGGNVERVTDVARPENSSASSGERTSPAGRSCTAPPRPSFRNSGSGIFGICRPFVTFAALGQGENPELFAEDPDNPQQVRHRTGCRRTRPGVSRTRRHIGGGPASDLLTLPFPNHRRVGRISEA